jgi:hypothetical protein
VRIDEAGDDDPPATIDDLGAGRGQPRTDGRDRPIDDLDVARDEVADVRVHRQDRRATDEQMGAVGGGRRSGGHPGLRDVSESRRIVYQK